ncbi:helix-turn-helix transcriptional regulator [Kitasatospora sp. NPDC058965]|uniref:helix-turn-helix domain-containing protein n=1 Tax=Kitasatospora sp. NPDC058965 TaxID=3346682 RepID=UPI0036AEA378
MNRRTVDPSSSALAAWAVLLRQTRESRELTQIELGKLINYSGAYISSVELAKRPPSPNFRKAADERLKTGGMLELMWRQLQLNAFIEGFSEFIGKEAEATGIRLVEFRLIPGLLQVEEYAVAWESGNVRRGRATQLQASERVKMLLTRQRCLARESPPMVHAVLDESCLHRPIGGREVMVRQLQRLEELAERPNVVLQIAPYSLGAEHPFTHSIVLLSTPNRTLLGYTESAKRGYLERDPETVAAWATDYDRLQVEALSRAASLEVIREARKELERPCRTVLT